MMAIRRPWLTRFTFASAPFVAAVAALLIARASVPLMAADAPATQPTNATLSVAPLATPPADAAAANTPASQPVITAAARATLDQSAAAYRTLHSLQIKGSISGDLDVDGQKASPSAKFSGSYLAPNKFVHETTDDVRIGSTGEKLYMYAVSERRYYLADGSTTSLDSDATHGPIFLLLREKNLSVAMAAAADPAAAITDGSVAVDRGPDITIDGSVCPTLKVDLGDVAQSISFDPRTHLVRRVDLDLTRNLLAQGAKKINAARLTFDFDSTTADAEVKPDFFAWSPPPGSQEFHPPQDVAALVGKPALAFDIKMLDGSPLTSKSLAGQVYAINFWATWCGPCVAEMPEMGKLYDRFKPAGLKMFAIDSTEDVKPIRDFVQATKLTIPVAVDAGGKLFGAYGFDAFPTTLLVGKDGKIVYAQRGADPAGFEAALAKLFPTTAAPPAP
jgi:thiol-disulfide isomerase/thioredoxin